MSWEEKLYFITFAFSAQTQGCLWESRSFENECNVSQREIKSFVYECNVFRTNGKFLMEKWNRKECKIIQIKFVCLIFYTIVPLEALYELNIAIYNPKWWIEINAFLEFHSPWITHAMLLLNLARTLNNYNIYILEQRLHNAPMMP